MGTGVRPPFGGCVDLVVAVYPLPALVTFLGFETKGGDRPGHQTRQPDRLTGFLAVAVVPFLDTSESFVDL